MEILEHSRLSLGASFKFHYLEHRLNDTSFVLNKTYFISVENELDDNNCRLKFLLQLNHKSIVEN